MLRNLFTREEGQGLVEAAPLPAPPMADTRQPTVVVVDDHADILAVLSRFLTMFGFKVVGWKDGLTAQAMIAQVQPHLVILDVRLPGVDGLTLFEHLRADPRTSTLPVIFFTIHEDVVQRHTATYSARGAGFVVKPDVHQLVALVQSILRPAAQGAPL